MADQEPMDMEDDCNLSQKQTRSLSRSLSRYSPVPSTGTSVYCWGNTDNGQLGLGKTEDDQILIPTEMKSFSGRCIREIACGSHHTLLLMKDGSVYSFGNNDSGQLGHDKATNVPGLFYSYY